MMKIVLFIVAIFALIAVPSVSAVSCNCGDICVDETGWWCDGGAFNASGTPIQAAVNNASTGDTICVKDGTYNENVDVGKRLTIRSENGSVNCIVNAANSNDHIFDVTVYYVNITGFTVKNANAGIYLYNVRHCNISDNNALNNSDGIYLRGSSNNMLTSNIANSNGGDGIYLRGSSNNMLTSNTANSNYDGIYLSSSSNDNRITNNTANSNGDDGIWLRGSSNNVLTSNTANSNGGDGIWLWSSSNNVLRNNTANSNNWYGIELWGSTSNNNRFTNNTMSGNKYNFDVGSPLCIQDIDTSNKVDGKPIYYWVNQHDKQVPNDAGFVGVVSSTNITVRDLILTKNGEGVLFVDTRDSRIENVTVSNNDYLGIYLYSSSNNRITNNIANSNGGGGIYLDRSCDNTLTNNSANSNNQCAFQHYTLGYGICLRFDSNNNRLTSNTANSNDRYGFYFGDSKDNTLTNNTANLNTDYGIWLGHSGNNRLTNNTMSGNKYNFGVFGRRPHYIQNIDTSNKVDGKPIYYWINQQDKQIPNDAGFVGVVSSTNITVRDLILTKNGEGVLFVDTRDSRIANVTANSNEYGIYLDYSSNNRLTNNNANSNDGCGIYFDHSSDNRITNITANSNNEYGIYLEDWSDNNRLTNITANSNNKYGIYLEGSSNNNRITNITANSNNKYGICLEYSSDNRLTNNTANSNNKYGIYLKGSSNNFIYNNYFDNTNNAWDDGNNVWNITKTAGTNIIGGPYLGGNYWSDYTGGDTDGDGLGDTLIPYNSYGDITNGGDWHPLVESAISLPDLVITEKWLCWPDNCTICYNVTNRGDGTAPACHNTALYVDDVEVAHDHVPVDLAPGESYTGCFNGYEWGYTPPSDNITVCADSNETIDELDETNNCLTNIWMCGDVNGDGKVTMSDVRKVFNRYLDPNYPLDSPWAADVNCDGKVTMSDVRKVFNRYLDPGYELDCCCEV